MYVDKCKHSTDKIYVTPTNEYKAVLLASGWSARRVINMLKAMQKINIIIGKAMSIGNPMPKFWSDNISCRILQ